MFLVNSRLGLVSAAPSRFGREVLHANGALLLPKLRSQFAEFLSQCYLVRLGILSLSTCVGLRYGRLNNSLRGFSWQRGITHFAVRRPRHHASELNGATDFPIAPSYTLEPPLPTGGWAILLRHPIVQTRQQWYRNIRLFPIDYAFRPRLRGRLTLSGLTFLRKP